VRGVCAGCGLAARIHARTDNRQEIRSLSLGRKRPTKYQFMTTKQFRDWAEGQRHLSLTPRGDYKWIAEDGTPYRYRVNELAVRLERWIESIKEWHRVRSAYCRDLWIEGGELKGMTREGATKLNLATARPENLKGPTLKAKLALED